METGSHSVTQVDLELTTVLLPQGLGLQVCGNVCYLGTHRLFQC